VGTAPDDALVERLRAAGCVFAEEEAAALREAAGTPAELDAMARRRTSGEPLEQVVGWTAFCGLRIGVEPGVFVPRRRSALLVHEAVRLLAAYGTGPHEVPVVVDLCCGSGALGAAIADGAATSGLGRVELYAADVDPVAVGCARRNMAAAGGHVVCGDLDEPLPAALRGAVRVLVANVPYVPTAAIAGMPPEARDHEPRRALDGGADGLDVLRRVAAAAPRWLAPGGSLLVETSDRQQAAAVAAVEAEGLTARVVTSVDLDATIVVGRWPGA